MFDSWAVYVLLSTAQQPWSRSRDGHSGGGELEDRGEWEISLPVLVEEWLLWVETGKILILWGWFHAFPTSASIQQSSTKELLDLWGKWFLSYRCPPSGFPNGMPGLGWTQRHGETLLPLPPSHRSHGCSVLRWVLLVHFEVHLHSVLWKAEVQNHRRGTRKALSPSGTRGMRPWHLLATESRNEQNQCHLM